MNKTWTPDLTGSSKPKYLALADAIERDIGLGMLRPNDRLPPQRELAGALDLDFTTVARGYAEARRRTLVDSHVGRGTFVTAKPALELSTDALRTKSLSAAPDITMNSPPEVQDADILTRMSASLADLSGELIPLLRYQSFGGADRTVAAAAKLLDRLGLKAGPDRVFVTPGTHASILAILNVLAKPGDTVLCEAITYPGIRSISAQLGLQLRGLTMDDEGINPEAFDEACRKHKPKAMYLNPTLQNPTTLTMSEARRAAVTKVARAHGVAVIEDDAYGFIPEEAVPPLATLAPELTWYVGGLSKWLGAGLRLAFVVAPAGARPWNFVGAMRSISVMASPITGALATKWIESGLADDVLRSIREETWARQALATERLHGLSYRSSPLSFNIWLKLENGWTRAAFASQMRDLGLGTVGAEAFVVDGTPEEAVRIGLGGPVTRDRLSTALDFLGHSLSRPPEYAAAFF